MKKITFLLGLALIFSGSIQSQSMIAYWNQNSNDLPGGGFGFLADPDAFPQDADLGVIGSQLTVGGGILNETETNSNGDLVYRWIPSFAGTIINAVGADEAGGSISIQGGTNTDNNGSYIQFQFSMAGHQDLDISYATRGTASGFDTQTWSWSTDGTNFTDFETVTGTNVTSFFLVEFDGPAQLNGVATAYLRVTFDGATTSTGNNRMDNIKFDGGMLSTTDFDRNGVSIYPNPVRSGGVVTINTNNSQPLQVTVYDVLGKKVLSRTISNNTLNVSSLKAGVYLVQVTDNNKTTTRKLVVN